MYTKLTKQNIIGYKIKLVIYNIPSRLICVIGGKKILFLAKICLGVFSVFAHFAKKCIFYHRPMICKMTPYHTHLSQNALSCLINVSRSISVENLPHEQHFRSRNKKPRIVGSFLAYTLTKLILIKLLWQKYEPNDILYKKKFENFRKKAHKLIQKNFNI